MASPRWFLLCLTLLGCGDGSTGTSGPILHGDWGSTGAIPARLIALGVAAEFQLHCSSVGSHDPVELAPDSTFVFTGLLRTSTPPFDGARARVQGQWAGETVTLSLDIAGDQFPSANYTLQRGVDPHFEDLPQSCLPD